jgi:hypothetical protein
MKAKSKIITNIVTAYKNVSGSYDIFVGDRLVGQFILGQIGTAVYMNTSYLKELNIEPYNAANNLTFWACPMTDIKDVINWIAGQIGCCHEG